LHRINPHRLQWIDQLAALDSKAVLDIGCGGGILAESMAKMGANVCGIDMAEKPLAIADWHAKSNHVKLQYAKSTAEEWAIEHPAAYDIVCCMEMLEHVPNPDRVVQACASMVKPGGWVFFSTINRNWLSYFVAIVGVEQVLRILPKGTHDFKKFIKPEELLKMANQTKLHLQHQRGLLYNPFTQDFKLHRFTGVAYLLAMQNIETLQG
jgi:2-polyprenyl-6-hydroxyphenyl methylase/3-demethylubiquinone-9 3-methyltransferase